MSDPLPQQQQQQHSSNSRKRGYDHHECEDYRRNSTDGQGATGTTAGGGYDSRRASRNLYDSSPPLKMHKDLPSHLLPQHPLQQQKQLQHRLLPQQREQKKRREQEEDPVSDYDSDIDNNDDELAPFPRSSSRFHQTNGNADSNSTRNSNDYYTHRSSSRADQSRSQSQAGMVQSMNNNSALKSSPPPESHPTHRQEDSGRGDLSDEEHWSREDARREGFRRWKGGCMY
ncbi:hypothetical protein BKA57DRAFT_201241 [Linnemannia elongata]|nr:hypothetical protein BKA57DRAFT_201241 [Linnemannia elongata]